MAVEWIKNNMLLSDNEHDKQSAEAELKVQLSLQEPSTSNCYLDKRSNSPKILNVMSTKHCVSCKNPISKRNYTPDSSSSDSIDISEHVKENVNEKTKKVAPPIIFHKNEVFCQQMLPETKHTRSSTKSSSPKEEILDVNIPIKKFPRKISKTFPKMSPSRKIQNINIVLPLGPKNEFTKDFKDMCNNDYDGDDTKKTFVLKERPFNVDRTIKTEDLKNVNVIIDKGKENRQKSASFQASQIVTTPLNAPDVKPKFVKLCANSIPKFSQASEVVTTRLNTPDVKPKFFKLRASSTPKFSHAAKVVTTRLNTPDIKLKFFKLRASSTPKFSQASEVVTTRLNTPDVKPKFFKLRASSTPKFSQAAKVVTTRLNTPDIKLKFFKLRASSIPKFSQASEVVTTRLNTPDVKPKFFKLRASSTPKFSQTAKVVTTRLNTPDVKPKFVKLRASSMPKFSQASEVVTTRLNTPDVKPKFFKLPASYTPKFSQAVKVVTTSLNSPHVKPNCDKYHVKSIPKFFQASEVVTTPSNTPNVKPKFFKLRANSTPKFSQAAQVITTSLNSPHVKPNCVKYHVKSIPKFFQPAEDVTPLSTPDVKPKFIKYRVMSPPKFSQIVEVVTTPLNTSDEEPNFVKHDAKSVSKSSQTSEVVTTPLNTPDVEPNFVKHDAKSVPKSSQASEVVTTPLNTPDVEPNFVKHDAKSVPKSSQASEVVTTPLNTSDVKSKFKLRANSTPNFSQARLFSSDIIEYSPKEKILSPNILEKSLISENKSMNVSNKSKNIRRSQKISPNLLEKMSIFEKSSMHNSFQESSNPIDLELPLQSKQLNRKKNIVKEIVRDLDEKARKSLQPRHSQDDDKESFVKRIVNALEKGDISRMRRISSRSSINGENSPSESETKSCVTSNSPKDTDYSDDGQRSPTLNSDDYQTFNSAHCKEDTLKVKEKDAEDDSVYWISIPKSTLPRSSSLLSMSNELSNYAHSPCISPIKSPNEVEYSLKTSWGATYKTSNALSKKLFHETVVIDSGYSD